MAYINPDVLDAALGVVDAVTALHICSQEPATYVAATDTYSLGSKATPLTTGPSDSVTPAGRRLQIDEISDGTVSVTGTASHWALVDGTRLLAAGSLSATQAVTAGNTFTLAAFFVIMPNPA